MLAGDIVLIIVFLQNQLVTYADGSAGHDRSGLQRLDPRPKEKNQCPSLEAEKLELVLGHLGSPAPAGQLGQKGGFSRHWGEWNGEPTAQNLQAF